MQPKSQPTEQGNNKVQQKRENYIKNLKTTKSKSYTKKRNKQNVNSIQAKSRSQPISQNWKNHSMQEKDPEI